MFARLLTLPFILGMAICLYFTYNAHTTFAYPLLPLAILLALVIVFSPQINWWWYNKHPPELDKIIINWLEEYHLFYQKLSKPNQLRFRQRVALFMMGQRYMGRNEEEEIEEDIKAFIACNAVQLTFGLPNFMMGKFENIVVYPKSFPSPTYPKDWHYSELYDEDGVLLFSRDQLIAGMTHQPMFLLIGLYEYAKALFIINPSWEKPELSSQDIAALESISKINNEEVKKTIGLDEIDWNALAVHHFLQFPKEMQAILPTKFNHYQRLLSLNPINEANPISLEI